jgi:hypothetical protein
MAITAIAAEVNGMCCGRHVVDVPFGVTEMIGAFVSDMKDMIIV